MKTKLLVVIFILAFAIVLVYVIASQNTPSNNQDMASPAKSDTSMSPKTDMAGDSVPSTEQKDLTPTQEKVNEKVESGEVPTQEEFDSFLNDINSASGGR